MIDLSAYRTLFADRELRRITLGSVLPRLPIGMNALGLTLLVQAATGSFAQAGWVSGAYMAALALQAPLVGRFIDQRGPRGVMLPLAAGHTLALLLVVLATHLGLGLPWLLGSAFLAGLFFPPVSTVIRAMYRKADMTASQRQSAFAVESVVVESCFILGPLLVSLALLAGSAAHAVLLAAGFIAVGVPLFARTGAIERWGQAERAAERHWLGPLRVVGVRRSLGLTLLVATGFGLNEIAVPAFATSQGAARLVGLFYAALSLPSAIAGLVYGTRRWGWPLNRQIGAAALWLAAGSALMALAPSPAWFLLACTVTGLAFGPLITALSLQLGALAPSATVTEAFTWSTTLLMLGLGLGMWLGGALVQQWGWPAALWAAAAAIGLAVLWSPFVPQVQGH
ncbi:MFS transporter [Ottowia testudinis]|uniref:MFS transporter n=1 Tax=Ottowia testudinis TaxID=2816950 RepID=A0A975CFD3_9BURK|nr:MFS transporter [Ottowia testudinis]QTD45428.1 MFS transporter [Ottowia testudinis]